MRIVPQPVQRSTYVLCASLVLLLLFWQWRPLPGVVWEVNEPVARTLLWALFALGSLTAIVVTFLINQFDLFGLRQAGRILAPARTRPSAIQSDIPLLDSTPPIDARSGARFLGDAADDDWTPGVRGGIARIHS